MNRLRFWLTLSLWILLGAACAPAATPTPAATKAPVAAATPAATAAATAAPAPTAAPTAAPVPATATAAPSAGKELGREVLAANDGWAAEGAGTSGGSAAKPDHVYTVRNRKELIAALNDGAYPAGAAPSNQPKIITIDGTIDANVDDNHQRLSCQDYQHDGFSQAAYNAAFDPSTWGRKPVTGTLETARNSSRLAQDARVRIRIGSNTTIVGLNQKAILRGAWFDLRGTASEPVGNVIIRNLTFQDTVDCFPQWDPTDGAEGNWNAQYDAISLRFANHVWIDHNGFEDRESADSKQPAYFGRLFQVHDGQLDITNSSDLVTVSWNRFTNHDKVMLIGSSDTGNTAAGDRGKLRVTLHHNLFANVGQRTPRVRFGQVHVYNNTYLNVNNPGYGYSWGIGIESQLYAENNYFKTDAAVKPAQLLRVFNGTAVHASGTRLNNSSADVDVVAAYNAANDPDLTPSVGWKPALVVKVDSVERVMQTVETEAGPLN